MNAIEIIDLCKEYRGGWRKPSFLAVNHLSLTIRQGEVFGFIGPNGAGKSTTIRMLTGVLKPTRGRASLFGISTELHAARRGVGYVPESPSLYEYLTPMEILLMSLRLHEVRIEQPEAHCLHWLERFELGTVANKLVRSFSKGMLQRVALAQAFAIKPRMLILDEPLSGLDPVGRKDVVDIIDEYRREGGTVFFTSHVLHDVERVADRFALIHQGVIRTLRSPAELASAEQRVLVRSVGSRFVDGMVSDVEGRWHIEVAGDNLWSLLEALRVAGHSLLEVRPALSLENAFLRFVEGEKQPHAHEMKE